MKGSHRQTHRLNAHWQMIHCINVILSSVYNRIQPLTDWDLPSMASESNHKTIFGERQTPPNYFSTTWHLNTWDVWQFWQISHRLAAVNDESMDALILWSAWEAMLNSFWLVCRQGRHKQDGNNEIGVEKEVEAPDCLRTLDSAR